MGALIYYCFREFFFQIIVAFIDAVSAYNIYSQCSTSREISLVLSTALPLPFVGIACNVFRIVVIDHFSTTVF